MGYDQITSVEVPQSVTKIGDSAFAHCKALKTVNLPDTLEKIEFGVFMDCVTLETITLPDSLKKIGDCAFYSCENLEDIVFSNNLEMVYLDSFNHTLWYENQPDGVVYAGNVAHSYKGEEPEDTKVVLKDGTTIISPTIFYGCDWLTEIEIPDSVKIIESYAFRGCTELKSVDLPDALTKINPYSFFECTSLETVNIPDGVKEIKEVAFAGCTSLTSITIPKSVTTIDTTAFRSTPLETIYGYKDSYAQQFATENDITFIALDGELPECDLYVSSASTVQSNIVDGDEVSFRATVRNLSENTSTAYNVSFYINGQLIETVEVDEGIEAGRSAQITSTVGKRISFGNSSITVMIECENDNENSNDRMKSRFTVE